MGSLSRITPLVLSLALTGLAHAYPTLTGVTGVVAVPTAAVIPPGMNSVTTDFHNTAGAAPYANAGTVRVLTSIAPHLELGVGVAQAKSHGDNAPAFSLATKYATPWGTSTGRLNFMADAGYSQLNRHAVADATDNVKVVSVDAGVGVLLSGPTEQAPNDPLAVLTLGLSHTSLDAGAGTQSAVRPFAALQFANNGRTSLGFEYQAKSSKLGDQQAITSLVVRHRFSRRTTLQAGLTNAINGSFGGDSHHLFAGLSYRLSGATALNEDMIFDTYLQ